MSKVLEQGLEPSVSWRYMTLVNREDPDASSSSSVVRSLSVPINHKQLNNLVGRLMQMCELIGDTKQRKALQDTIKQICREWLDNEYADAGYDRYGGSNGKDLKTVNADYYNYEQ